MAWAVPNTWDTHCAWVSSISLTVILLLPAQWPNQLFTPCLLLAPLQLTPWTLFATMCTGQQETTTSAMFLQHGGGGNKTSVSNN